MKSVWYYDTVLGRIGIVDNGRAVSGLFFAGESPVVRDAAEKETDLLRRAAKELKEFLAGKRRGFTVPLEPEGTDFQKAVWTSLRDIPYGETRSYGQIASAVGNPKACRAVGLANNKNPVAVIIPCHRVVGADGSLVGYAGGLDKKQLLLDLEGRQN